MQIRGQLKIIAQKIRYITTKKHFKKCNQEVAILIKANSLLEEAWNKPALITCALLIAILATFVVIMPQVYKIHFFKYFYFFRIFFFFSGTKSVEIVWLFGGCILCNISTTCFRMVLSKSSGGGLFLQYIYFFMI